MAKTKISEWSATSADNTDISNINIAEGCSPANVNNAIRTVMSQVKDLQAGTSGDTIPLTAGGTGSANATDARTALSAAKSGANSDITSITGLTTALSTLQGGTGAIQKAISNVARTSNVVTITTSTAHGFTAGDYVTVAAVTSTTINGTYLIASVGSTTFTYALNGGDFSTTDTGTVLDITYCNLTNNVTGTLAVAKGGTGATTLNSNALLIGNKTSAFSVLKPSTNGNVVTSTAGSTVSNNSFIVGAEYTVLTLGTTSNAEWNTIGGTTGVTYAVGTVFTAAVTGTGSGNGNATTNVFSMTSINTGFIGSNQSLSTDGYQKFPGGLIMQWGTTPVIAGPGTLAITFAVAFPTNCANVQITIKDESADTSSTGIVAARSVTTTGFTLRNGEDPNMIFNWLAIGY
jgi:hypothetical protein